MNQFIKKLVTGTLALGLLAPVATSAIYQPRTNVSAHASSFHKYFRSIRGLKESLSMNSRYAYLYSKPRNQPGMTIRYRLHYRGHNNWQGYNSEYDPITIRIYNNKIFISGLGVILHYMYGRNNIKHFRRRTRFHARRPRRNRRRIQRSIHKHVSKREPLYMWYKQNSDRLAKKYIHNKYFKQGDYDAGDNNGQRPIVESKFINNKYYKMGWVSFTGSVSVGNVLNSFEANGSSADYKAALQDYDKAPKFLKKHGNPSIIYIAVDQWHVDHDPSDYPEDEE